MKWCISQYKCRLCGQLFGNTIIDKHTAANALAAITERDNITAPLILDRYSVHFCDENSVGFADFVGFAPCPNGRDE